MTKQKVPIIDTMNQPAETTINLQLPLTGAAAQHFSKLKESAQIKQNAELARMIFIPVLAVCAKIGVHKFLALITDHGDKKAKTNRTGA